MSHDSDPFHPVVRNLEENNTVSQKYKIVYMTPKIKKKDLSKWDVMSFCILQLSCIHPALFSTFLL
jgi:hypothetical protein